MDNKRGRKILTQDQKQNIIEPIKDEVLSSLNGDIFCEEFEQGKNSVETSEKDPEPLDLKL